MQKDPDPIITGSTEAFKFFIVTSQQVEAASITEKMNQVVVQETVDDLKHMHWIQGFGGLRHAMT
jgi:hypothetical protein